LWQDPILLKGGDELKPEIHLYQKGLHKDFWPGGHAQAASDIPPGTYEIDVFQPGFKRFHRDVDVISGHTEVRVVLLVATEATGQPFELAGTIFTATNNVGMWILAFPLAGNPSDVTEVRVGHDGHFKITAPTAGPYLLAVLQGDKVVRCESVYIGNQNREQFIDLTKPGAMPREARRNPAPDGPSKSR
jgi:hypothetical protein